jgi:peptidoglycan/xylan/chitin deacetylase (PgdA/CDA1 family)
MMKMLGLLVGTGAALVYAGYNTMAPRSQLYGRTFIGNGKKPKELALTYDDGPNDPHTQKILEVLAKHSVKATFFLIGRFVDQRPDIVRDIVKEGHVVANHTYTHPNLIFATQARFREELARCERALDDAVGEQHAPLFRPPYGGRRPAVIRTLREEEFQPVLWSVSSWDWDAKSAEQIENKVDSQVRGGDVILLHDGGNLKFGTDRSFTVQASDRMIARYKDEGYDFKTVPQMMST